MFINLNKQNCLAYKFIIFSCIFSGFVIVLMFKVSQHGFVLSVISYIRKYLCTEISGTKLEIMI